ncbi:MAG: TonB-dependent receptor, partial [Gammaproteobacteria bacterium]|nr:TonB-dependent receptor [Gammaproteobacteria bacterium]
QTEYDHMPRNDQSISIDWGTDLNEGRTNVGIFARRYSRDRVRASDESRWANSDFRHRFPPTSPYAVPNPQSPAETSTVFRNDSANSLFGQFDVVSSLGSSHSLRVNDVVDAAGEFEIYPTGDSRCAGGFDTGYGTCMHEDGQGTIRYNFNANRDVMGEADRTTIFAYVNHEMNEDLEFFSDVYYYDSTSSRDFGASTPLTAVPLRVGAQNYYNPLGPCGSPNRLPDSIIGTDVPCSGLELRIDNYRFAEKTRVVDNNGDAYRLLAGFRGIAGDWDWETAAIISKATRDDITHNRISNTLITEALFDPTPAAYNPFSGGVDSNIERAYIDVYRRGSTTLRSFDVKFSNPEIFEMPAGPAGMLIGAETRREDFRDDRDPRLNGTIDFTDFEGESYPLTSDVVNSSPTPDNEGGRSTVSFFGELQLPLHETIDVQLAARYEDFSDIGDTTVGKFAIGWQPHEMILLRGSASTAFRAPNLITINEGFVARSNTRDDWVCFYAVDNGTLPADNDFSDCDYGMQRQATGSKGLVPEESINLSAGFVFEPIENLTLTFDYWSIEKEDTIGLFGEENHVLVDLVTRLEQGTSNCAAVVGHPNVVRDTPTTDPVEMQGFLDAGLCPIGSVLFVSDQYANLDTRTVEGFDVGLYYDFETSFGSFAFKYNGSFYEKYEQQGTSGITASLIEAKAADPTIVYPIAGIGDLLNLNGNQESRMTASLAWYLSDWSVGVSANRISSFHQLLSNGDIFPVPSMTTYNAKFDYTMNIADVDTRVRLGVNNITDERAPLYDRSFGYSDDAHRDWGLYYYLDLRLDFGG